MALSTAEQEIVDKIASYASSKKKKGINWVSLLALLGPILQAVIEALQKPTVMAAPKKK